MSEPYLIAHLVRGQPAFDIAERGICVLCQSYESVLGNWVEARRSQEDCDYCNGLGYVWHIPTSGHGAKPYWSAELRLLIDWKLWEATLHEPVPNAPEDWPDHYAANDRQASNHNLNEYGDVIPAKDKVNASQLLLALGLTRPKPTITRRS